MKVTRHCSRVKALATVFAILLATAATADAANSLPQLWPRFSEPSAIVNIGLTGQSGDDFMAITSFQGAYNQQERSSRLYVNTPADATYWLAHAVPAGVTITNLPYTTSDPHSSLKTLLSTYGPQGTNTITKYVVCDPVNIPESCNMATTLAGINDAMVVNPDNLSVIAGFGLTEIADLRTYQWIGSNPDLVGNTTVNMIKNPSGGSGTSGWTDNGGTLATGTPPDSCGGGGSTLEWTRTSGTGDQWAWYNPSIPSARINVTPYIFSVQVCVSSGSPVFLDVWNGAADIKSASVGAGAGWQTLQLAVPLPKSGATGNTTIKLQVRTSGSSTNVYFQNAAVVDNRVAIDLYQYKNLLPQTSGLVMAQDFPTSGNLRDYLVAAKVFTFALTDDANYKDELALYQQILQDPHTGHVTPILGYIDHENEDVNFLSSPAGNGHFLNASDNYNNGSVWASFPQPAGLSQNAPSGVQATNGTVYLALAMSDGDNVSFVQHQDVSRWTNSSFFGAVPMAWTTAPGMLQFAPGLLSNFYALLPQSQEMMSGPSGVGYTRGITGSDLSTFASLTNQFMTAETMSTVTDWPGNTADLDTFATETNVPHVLWNNCLGYNTQGPLPTVVDGQCVGYQKNAAAQVAAIESSLSSTGNNPYQGPGAPTFLEALNANTSAIPPDDVLYVAQQLQLQTGYNFVFLTPSELALTEEAYKNGTSSTLPIQNAQAVSGSMLLTAFPQNVLWNAQGQSGNYNTSSTGWALGTSGHGEALISTIYNGSGCQQLTVPGSKNATVYAWEYLANTPVAGRYYRFTATVAGSGTAEMTIYNGSANIHSAPITLTPSFQTITMMVQMNSTSKGQIQIGLNASSSPGTLYFNGGTAQPVTWYYGAPSSTGGFVSAGGTTYNNGSFTAPAMSFSVPAGQSSVQSLSQFPGDTPSLLPNTSYTATVDVAGTPGGQAYLDLSNGSTDSTSSTATLRQQWQTLTTSFTTGASPNQAAFEIAAPSGTSANETIYFRNATLVPTSSLGTIDFYSGLESGQPQLTWTNTVDTSSKGGGHSDVTDPILEPASTITRGGSYAIQYQGVANGGSSGRAYMQAFSNDTTLTSSSRLSYWIFPMSPMGAESGASATTGLNSTCVAVDLVFSDGSALRQSGATDQYGNQMHASHECNHLQPDQWNYVTVDLSKLAGKTVNRIDVDYEDPGASGTYGGFVDDITLSH